MASDDRFEWRPPVSPRAERRRVWLRIGYVGFALVIAVIGVVSAWGDPVGVVLSAVTVPGLILLAGGAFDYVLGRNRRFRIVVDDGVLTVDRAGRERSIPLTGATVGVDTQSHLQTTPGSSAMTRTVFWMLTVRAPDGSELLQKFPGWGTTTRRDDYVALERELRQRT